MKDILLQLWRIGYGRYSQRAGVILYLTALLFGAYFLKKNDWYIHLRCSNHFLQISPLCLPKRYDNGIASKSILCLGILLQQLALRDYHCIYVHHKNINWFMNFLIIRKTKETSIFTSLYLYKHIIINKRYCRLFSPR